MEGKLMAVPIYVWNGTAWESTGPTIPASPIKYQASAPTSPSTGDIWVDSDADVTSGSQQFQRFRFVASGGETTISGADANGAVLAYTAGAELVVLNGSTLVRGQDYTATNGTSITGLSPALVASDVLEVFSFIAFTVANTYTQSQVDGLIGGTGTLSGAWTSYTPTVNNWTLGNGTLVAAYKQIGKTVFFRIDFTVGSTTNKAGNLSFSLPVTANSSFASAYTVHTYLLDTGTDEYYFTSEVTTANVNGIYQLSGGNNRAISPTAPFTWVTGDRARFWGFYEAA